MNEQQRLRDFFNAIDSNRSGKVSRKEFHAMAKCLGCSVNFENKLFQNADENQSGHINMNELIHACEHNAELKYSVLSLADIYFTSKVQQQPPTHQVGGGTLPSKDIEAIKAFFCAMDTNRSGRINRDEFKQMAAKVGLKPDAEDQMFRIFDKDADGGITMDELTRVLAKNPAVAAKFVEAGRAYLNPPNGNHVPPQPPIQPAPVLVGSSSKKALLIGINYFGQKSEVRGCVNNVKLMKQFLLSNGFAEQNMRILVDDPSWKTEQPTKRNILSAFQWLAGSARSGDCLFFYYGGHGGQLPDYSGSEATGYDSTLCPVDHQTAGQIRDDDVFQHLVQPLPQGCRLTALCDCCHSGTVFDLPYIYVARKNQSTAVRSASGSSPPPQMIPNPKFGKVKARDFAQQGHKMCKAEVIMFSGCADDRVAFDLPNAACINPANPGAGSACTNSFLAALASQPKLTLVELLEKMRAQLERKKLEQVPQLSSSHALPMTHPFSLELLRH